MKIKSMREHLDEVSYSNGQPNWHHAANLRSDHQTDLTNMIPQIAGQLYHWQFEQLRPLIHGIENKKWKVGIPNKHVIFIYFSKYINKIPELKNHELIGMISYNDKNIIKPKPYSELFISFSKLNGEYYTSRREFSTIKEEIYYSDPEQITYDNITILFKDCQKIEIL